MKHILGLMVCWHIRYAGSSIRNCQRGFQFDSNLPNLTLFNLTNLYLTLRKFTLFNLALPNLCQLFLTLLSLTELDVCFSSVCQPNLSLPDRISPDLTQRTLTVLSYHTVAQENILVEKQPPLLLFSCCVFAERMTCPFARYVDGLRKKLITEYPLHQTVAPGTNLLHVYYPGEFHIRQLVPLTAMYIVLFMYVYFSVRKVELVRSKVRILSISKIVFQ